MTDTVFSDIRKNPIQALAVAAFAFASCFLTSLGVMMFSGLMNGLDAMMERAEVPHFLQMHSGSIEDADFSSFSENEDVLDFQIVPYLNIDNNEFISD